MTQTCWDNQKPRFIDRFGAKNFSKEFSLLVLMECRDVSDQDFVEIANFMIGSRSANKPPLLHDFRDARLIKEKAALRRNIEGALNSMQREAKRDSGLYAFLAKEYGSECKTLNQAVEIQIERNRIEKALGGE